MSKALLVIDRMPEYCDEHCKFCDSFFNCQYAGDVEEAYKSRQRDAKCPLKPMPEKIPHDDNDYEDVCEYWEIEGYNRCIDEILGENRDE